MPIQDQLLGMLMQVGWFVSYLGVVFVLARRTQIEAWVTSNPKAALVLRMLRAIGPDPLLALKALREFLAAKSNIKDLP